ncbi:MAG TPA: GNAT family N-acetyltransferase [Jatrophihabitans sp.]|nr:GNAT family N-acetyltransferase [Jatrophihabitans sp.]
MSQDRPGRLRQARPDDAGQLLSLWQSLFDELPAATATDWQEPAHEWFAQFVDEPRSARIPVIEVAGELVASAVGVLEQHVPNPMSPTGRAVRLVNVITLPDHRGHGYATELISDVIDWSRRIATDRIDLSATAQGQRIYQRLGFLPTSALRMKLVIAKAD